ncbi:hypothetical protein M758_11G081300 [Ceratodon purpureus]|uniref:GrpE protein homolog n=1 Tax=Ceratodon purpureus TaxID=3225 RepID=A0A8T0GFD0_CERPU|nr:hypothetical protein KC19_11G084500 [Ceratodon purpureus]KAG0601067.1 hypothetical protein M758_11G081300 [Ceratodon purpureus]
MSVLRWAPECRVWAPPPLPDQCHAAAPPLPLIATPHMRDVTAPAPAHFCAHALAIPGPASATYLAHSPLNPAHVPNSSHHSIQVSGTRITQQALFWGVGCFRDSHTRLRFLIRAMSNVKHARLLLKAFQKAPQIRCFRAPPSSVPRSGKSVTVRKLGESEFLSPLSKRWTTAMLHQGVPQVSSASHFHTFTKLSSAASPNVSDKMGSSETSATEAKSTATAEETSEPVQRVDTPSDEKGNDLAELLAERDALLEEKETTIKELQDKVLRSYAEVENVMARARREAESTRKFALQGFAKGLLDVADNLGRATGAVPERFRQVDSTSEDPSGAAKLLVSLLQGVEMTEKQLQQVCCC